MKAIHYITNIIIIVLDFLWNFLENLLLASCAVIFALGVNKIVDVWYGESICGFTCSYKDILIAVIAVTFIATLISFIFKFRGKNE